MRVGSWIMRAHTILSGVFALCTLAGTARAAGPDPAEHRLAREEMQKGLAAATENRWEDARAAFERAYALSPKPSFLFNLAGAQAKTGLLVEAAESYRLVLREGELPAEQRKAAKEALERLEPRIARLRIVVRGGTRADDAITLDGRPLSLAAVAADLPTNPGRHEVALARPGWRAPPVVVVLEEGETRAATLVPVEEPAPKRAPVDVRADEQKSSITRSPWFWIGVGVVVVGGTVTAVCLAGACSKDEPQPFQGSLGNVTFP